MTSWNNKTKEYIETPERQKEFLKEIEEVCKKYNLSISHEDGQGSFELDTFNQDNIEWLEHANINYL